MRRLVIIIALTAVVGVLGSTVLARASVVTDPVPCLATDDFALSYRSYILRVTTTQDTRQARFRTNFRLPLITDSSTVAYVTDTTVCTQAASAHAIVAGETTGTPRPVHVLRVGPTRYIVWNDQQVGEFDARHVFDDNFTFLVSLGS